MLPFEVTSAVLDGASPLCAWRAYRRLQPEELARAAAIDPDVLSKLERRARAATGDELERLADALGVEVDDLIDPPP